MSHWRMTGGIASGAQPQSRPHITPDTRRDSPVLFFMREGISAVFGLIFIVALASSPVLAVYCVFQYFPR